MTDQKGKPTNNSEKVTSVPPTTEYVKKGKEPNVNKDKNR
jgi:hypothetical protein